MRKDTFFCTMAIVSVLRATKRVWDIGINDVKEEKDHMIIDRRRFLQ